MRCQICEKRIFFDCDSHILCNNCSVFKARKKIFLIYISFSKMNKEKDNFEKWSAEKKNSFCFYFAYLFVDLFIFFFKLNINLKNLMFFFALFT